MKVKKILDIKTAYSECQRFLKILEVLEMSPDIFLTWSMFWNMDFLGDFVLKMFWNVGVVLNPPTTELPITDQPTTDNLATDLQTHQSLTHRP